MKNALLSLVFCISVTLPVYSAEQKLIEFDNGSVYIYSKRDVTTKNRNNRVPIKIIKQNECISFKGEAQPNPHNSNIDSDMNLKLCLLDKLGNFSGNLTIYWKMKHTIKPQSSIVKGKFYEKDKFFLYETPKIKGNGIYKNIKYDFFDGTYKGTYYYYNNYRNILGKNSYNFYFEIK